MCNIATQFIPHRGKTDYSTAFTGELNKPQRMKLAKMVQQVNDMGRTQTLSVLGA